MDTTAFLKIHAKSRGVRTPFGRMESYGESKGSRRVRASGRGSSTVGKLTASAASDWYIVGVCGPRHLAEQIKGELATFLATHLRLKLSQDKTHITNARNGHTLFLGTQITIGRGGEQRVVMTRNGSGHAIRRRSTGSETHMTVPMDRVIAQLHSRGFCTAEGESTTKLGWIHLDPEQVIALYSGINRGIQNYYRFTDNFDKLSRIQHILRFSLARTLAAKYKV